MPLTIDLSKDSVTPPPPPVVACAQKRSAPALAQEAAPPKKKKASKKSDQPHCIIWVCTNGKGQSRAWSQGKLKLVGVYSSKAAAEHAKGKIMSQHDCIGHGDILVGGTWDDEIDLVIRPAPMFMNDE